MVGMSQAPTYTRATGFANEERDNVGGRSTVRTAQVDAELDAISTSINALQANQALNQRDDGEIRDGRVKIPALASEVLALLISYGVTPRGAWLTATTYALKDLVSQGSNTYMATVPHVAGTFATDLASGKWLLLALGATPTAAAIPFTPTATISSSTIQAAIEEADSEGRALSAAALTAAGVVQNSVNSLSADLASSSAGKGDALIAVKQPFTGAVERTQHDKNQESVHIKDFGGVGDGVVDDTAAFEKAAAYLHSVGGGELNLDQLTYKVTGTTDFFRGTAKPIRLVGKSRFGTVIAAHGNFVVFQHAEYFEAENLSVIQTGTPKTGTAFATPTGKQAAYCKFEGLNIEGFRFGQWWRYSIWNTVKDVRWFNCGVGLKGSRNANFTTSGNDTNPAAPGAWNLDPGFFHNHNRFELCVADGCEIGVWGTFHTTYFDLTCQNGTGTGSGNAVAPAGLANIGLWLQNSGSGTSTFGATSNIVEMYAEYVQQPIVSDYADYSLQKLFAQGGANSGSAYKQIIAATGGSVNAVGVPISASDFFQYKLVAANCTVIGDISNNGASATIAPESLTSASYYQFGMSSGVTTVWSLTGVADQPVATAINRNTYDIAVVGLYNGATVVSGRWLVSFWQSGLSRVQADAGNSSDLSVNVSGSTIQVRTGNPLGYDLRATVIRHRAMSQSPYTN